MYNQNHKNKAIEVVLKMGVSHHFALDDPTVNTLNGVGGLKCSNYTTARCQNK